jgi:hypothetical protein
MLPLILERLAKILPDESVHTMLEVITFRKGNISRLVAEYLIGRFMR